LAKNMKPPVERVQMNKESKQLVVGFFRLLFERYSVTDVVLMLVEAVEAESPEKAKVLRRLISPRKRDDTG